MCPAARAAARVAVVHHLFLGLSGDMVCHVTDHLFAISSLIGPEAGEGSTIRPLEVVSSPSEDGSRCDALAVEGLREQLVAV